MSTPSRDEVTNNLLAAVANQRKLQQAMRLGRGESATETPEDLGQISELEETDPETA